MTKAFATSFARIRRRCDSRAIRKREAHCYGISELARFASFICLNCTNALPWGRDRIKQVVVTANGVYNALTPKNTVNSQRTIIIVARLE
jgi:hypothetical protein